MRFLPVSYPKNHLIVLYRVLFGFKFQSYYVKSKNYLY